MIYQGEFASSPTGENHLSCKDFLNEKFALKVMYIMTELANRLTDFSDTTPVAISHQRYQTTNEHILRCISDKREIQFKKQLLKNESEKISPTFRRRISQTPTTKLIHWVETL